MKKLLLPIALVAATSVVAFAQSRVVKGRVLDESGEAVLGASVVIKGTQSGTVTDDNGNFTISVPEGSNTLVISSLGLGTQEVTAGDGNQPVTVSFANQKSTELQEAVVIGYGTVNRKQFIGGSSVVKSESFENKAMGSFTNMLQGKAPGVQITAQNGAPGSNAFIRVRGTGSLASGNAPLIVIDGVPSTADAYNSLNPSDIKSVNILKDASSTAIYGSRGSNGVLLITTKRGEDVAAGDAKITYGLQVGVKTKTPDKFKMMNADQKLAFERELGYTNEYLVPLLTADGYNDISEVPESVLQGYYAKIKQNQTDWMSNEGPILRKGRMQQHDLSVSGRTDKLNYLISGQIYDEDGISYGSFFNRKAGTVAFDYKAKPWLKIGQNTRVAYNTGRTLRDRYNAQNPFVAMYQYNPYESPYDFTNGYNGYNFTTQGFNVVEAIQGNPSFYNNFYGFSTTYAELTPIKKLTVRTQLGMQYNVYQQENFTKPGSILDVIVNGTPTGSKTDISNNRFNYVWSNTAEYKTTINTDHNLTALVGTEFTKDNFKSYSLSSTGFPVGVTTQENGAKPTATTTSRVTWAMMSYFGRLGYNYKGKYAASATIRTDGSSRFSDDTKFGTFWSLGGSWLISDENFIKNKRTLSYLKLWGTVGTSGNDQIGNYPYQQLYRFSNYDNAPVGYPYQPGTPSLTWEKNTNYSFGLDFGLLNDRISGNITYYNRNTNGLIMENPLSPTTGFTSRTENRGAMTNRGIELQVQADVIRTQDFVWSVGANYTHNRNRVTDLGGKDTIPSLFSTFGYNIIGQPTDVYRMQKYAGVDQATGAATWYTQDGGVTSDYAQAGVFVLDKKSADPRFFGGFNTSFTYKGIGLGFDFSYVGGLYTYNNQWKDFNSASNYYQNLAAEASDYWTPSNTGAKSPALDVGDNIYDSDRWLQRADMIRLRNVVLSYNLPNNVLKRVRLSNLRVYLQGQNLWYYSPSYKGDPEVGVGSAENDLNRQGNISLYSYPQTKALTLGLSVTF